MFKLLKIVFMTKYNKILGMLAVLGLSAITIYAQEQGVVINGVTWATRNVGAHGNFVTSAENYGEFYTWYEAQNVCPAGWRLPTKEELQSLIDAGGNKTRVKKVNGLVFGSKNNAIFLPAAGLCDSDNAIFGKRFFYTYWSSTSKDDNSAWTLFSFGREKYMNFLGYRSVLDKSCIRCVAE